MIPSVVAHEVARALRDFLATGFGPSNPPLAHVLDDFLAEQENLVKGPYLSIALPPKLAPDGHRTGGFGGATSRARCAIWWWTNCTPSTGRKAPIWRA